jgi:hypothetical protein
MRYCRQRVNADHPIEDIADQLVRILDELARERVRADQHDLQIEAGQRDRLAASVDRQNAEHNREYGIIDIQPSTIYAMDAVTSPVMRICPSHAPLTELPCYAQNFLVRS